MILGTQESVAGGLHLAFGRLARDRGEALQIFSKSSRQWAAPALTETAVTDFKSEREKLGGQALPVAAHASYLINLAAPSEFIYQRSIAALVDECERAERLGVDQVVVHPGAALSASVAVGMARVVTALQVVCGAMRGMRVRLLLEITAGQGSCVGCSLEQLAELLQKTGDTRLGVCLDTQHMYAVGLDWTTPRGYEQVMKDVERLIGVSHVEAFHLNDSKKGLGLRVDRHERIGDGIIGLAPFGRLITDERWAAIAGYLETPPLANGEDSFGQGLERLRSLAKPIKKSASRARP